MKQKIISHGAGIREMSADFLEADVISTSQPVEEPPEDTLARQPGTMATRREAPFDTLRNWLAVIIGIVIAYQIATLGRQGLWYDEVFTVMVSLPEYSLTDIFRKHLLMEQSPPLYYVLMHFWQLVAPRGDWAMRVPGLYFYVLTIAAAALYPCRAMNTAKRLTFVALVGCSYGTIYFAQEVRTYSLFGLLAICILYDMLDHAAVLDNGRLPSWPRLAWSAVVGLAASYSHYYGFLFFGAATLSLLGYSIAHGKIAWRIVALGAVVFLGFLPWTIAQFGYLVWEFEGNIGIVDRPIGVARGFLRHLVGSPLAGAFIALLGIWALSLHAHAVLTSRALWLTVAVIAINLLVPIVISLHTPILNERYLTGVRMATLLAFTLVIAEVLYDRRAQILLIATAGTLFVSFILTQAPKASWREPATYIKDHTTCDRREILFYSGLSVPAWVLSYYLPDDRFIMMQSEFDSDVVHELAQLNPARPGCDVVAMALNLDPKDPEIWEAALAKTPFRGAGYHLEEWPTAFVVRRVTP
jgi:hypothetical protein